MPVGTAPHAVSTLHIGNEHFSSHSRLELDVHNRSANSSLMISTASRISSL